VRCVLWNSFQPSLSVLAARFCARGLRTGCRACPISGTSKTLSKQERGTARRVTQPVLMCTHPLEGCVAPPGAPSGVFLTAPVRAHWGTGFSDSANRVNPTCGGPASCVLPRSGPSARGSESGAARARGLLATPAGAGPIHTSRRNRFASLMGIGRGGIKS
jgi:hypothetical protein